MEAVLISVSRKNQVLGIAVQVIVLSILTLVTIGAFIHIVTMLLFRRLVIGRPKQAEPSENALENEEFFVPVRSILSPAASVEDQDRNGTLARRVARRLSALWNASGDLHNILREGLITNSGISREVYVKHFQLRPKDSLAQYSLAMQSLW